MILCMGLELALFLILNDVSIAPVLSPNQHSLASADRLKSFDGFGPVLTARDHDGLAHLPFALHFSAWPSKWGWFLCVSIRLDGVCLPCCLMPLSLAVKPNITETLFWVFPASDR